MGELCYLIYLNDSMPGSLGWLYKKNLITIYTTYPSYVRRFPPFPILHISSFFINSRMMHVEDVTCYHVGVHFGKDAVTKSNHVQNVPDSCFRWNQIPLVWLNLIHHPLSDSTLQYTIACFLSTQVWITWEANTPVLRKPIWLLGFSLQNEFKKKKREK